MKLWNKETSIDKTIESFTIGKDNVLDLELAKYDIIGSKAHATMLASIGILSAKELEEIMGELDHIMETVEAGKFQIEEGVEDIHSQVEKMLIEEIGEAGKKIHTARSRNDQVLLDLRLYFRDKLDELAESLHLLVHDLTTKSEDTKNFLMPGYTHMQVGMVSSFGMWFGAYAEALVDDFYQVQHTRKRINQNPLGSAAGYGSSFGIDRKQTTELLGFDDLCYNAMYAQFGRGKTELLIAQSICTTAFTISKFAYDVCMFSNQNYALIKLPDAVTTGSSIMPHKKNPDVFELIRARCNQLQTLPTQVLMVIQNLPSGYHRDFQQLKEIIFPAFAVLKDIIDILSYVLPKIEVNPAALDHPKYDTLFSVDGINALVQTGVPMREAYHIVKQQLESGEFEAKRDLEHTHIGSIGNLANAEILEKLGHK